MNESMPNVAPTTPPGIKPVAVPAPIVTYILMGVTILIYILEITSESFLGTNYPVALGIKYNDGIMAGQWWRLFTATFLHGPIFHIALQMLWLYLMGRGVEPLFGKLRFFLLYVLSGFAGNVLSFLFTSDLTYGSGSALFGLIAAQVAFLYINREIYGAQVWVSLRNIGLIIALNFLIMFLPGIDKVSSIGGLLGGLLFSFLAAPKMAVIALEVNNQPVVMLKDTRTTRDSLIALAIMLIVFGGLAALKIFGVFAF
jgi:rhomboid protease GluP